SIVEVIFTKGQLSHPHFKEEIITDIRKKEAGKVAKKIGLKEVIFLDLNEGSIADKKGRIILQIKKILEKYNPEKVFTLSSSETHPDHRDVNKIVLAAVDSLNKKYPVYTFNIWTIPKIIQNPIMYVDISHYFWRKISLMKQHRSQWLMMYYPQILPVVFRAKYYGIKNKCKYAEKFEKVR
ncbi:MAG: PIG-L family deacetylase, partial [Nanoarchaeota archaeon]